MVKKFGRVGLRFESEIIVSDDIAAENCSVGA
jgi:hypothetical protein